MYWCNAITLIMLLLRCLLHSLCHNFVMFVFGQEIFPASPGEMCDRRPFLVNHLLWLLLECFLEAFSPPTF